VFHSSRSLLDKLGERISDHFSYLAYRTIRDHTTSFAGVLCVNSASANVSTAADAGLLQAEMVSGNYFRTLGVDSIHGRTISPDDDQVASAPVVVLTHGFWQRAFAGDPDVLGKSIAVNGEPFEVIGVAPRGFYGVDPRLTPDLIVPIAKHAIITGSTNRLANGGDWSICRIVGRVGPAISAERARAESEALVRDAIIANSPAQEYVPPRIWLSPFEQGVGTLRRGASQSLYLLLAATGLILLIACANLAGLLLARSTVRRHEIGTRLALGASRGRLIRQLLTESLLLAGLGGGLGIALAYALAGLIPTPQSGSDIQRLGVELTPDPRVLAIAIVVTVMTGLVFGLAPALRATSIDVLSMMRARMSSSKDGHPRFRSGKALVTIQVALSFLLLIAAGLFVRTLVNAYSEPLGFQPAGVLVFQANPSLNGYRDQRALDYFESGAKRLEGVPGVMSASMSMSGLIGDYRFGSTTCMPDYKPARPQDSSVDLQVIAPRFFETMQIPLLLGRDIDWADREGTPKVAIVNEAFAKRFFSGTNPIGKTFGMRCPEAPNEVTILGLVGDVKADDVRPAMRPTVYVPFRQRGTPFMTYAVRANGDPAALIPTIRKVMGNLDRNVPIHHLYTQAEQIDRSLHQERLVTTLLVVMGSVALLLAAIGIYGTIAYSVNRRTPEIGLRLAIGARRTDVIRLMLGEALLPVAIGLALGLSGAFWLTRILRGMLFGVTATDPLTIVTAVLVLLATAVVAAWLPANRASRIDPMTALRYE
jgi:predicted permease